LVIATNVNDILARALRSGAYEVQGVVPTTSPSMDIQVASNFERALFEAVGRDPRAIRTMMSALAQSRRFIVPGGALSELRALFSADCADEQETAATIRTVRREAGYLIDPHTAVAIAVAEKERRDSAVPMIALATAHPCKFPAAVEAACGVRPALPDWLADLPHKPERQTVLPADQTAVESFISSVSRVAREGAAA
jgi:threonine synthase